MRKIKIYISVLMIGVLCLFVFSGCPAKKENTKVYSFSGENNEIAVTNGVIILSNEDDIFYGGDIDIKFNNTIGIKTIRKTFYIDSKENTIMSNYVFDATGSKLQISKNFGGRLQGNSLIDGTEDELMNKLFFEFETTDKNGKSNIYIVKLDVVEVTSSIKK